MRSLIIMMIGIVTTSVLMGGFELNSKPSPELIAAKSEEQIRYDKGPKFKSGCYKIINKEDSRYNCTFQSTQGSMFLTTDSQQRGYRDRHQDGTAVTSPATWQLIWNKRIKCLDNGGFFVHEEDVKPIKCPEYLYTDGGK